MKLTEFKQDQKKATEGVLKYFDAEKKCYVRVARMNNPAFEAAMRRLTQPYKSFRKSKIPDRVADEIAKQAMAETILLEMVGFEDAAGDITGKAGSVIEDTYENRLAVLSHKDYSDFLEMISQISFDFDSYKAQEEAEELGN
jgi:hypothetical protein